MPCICHEAAGIDFAGDGTFIAEHDFFEDDAGEGTD